MISINTNIVFTIVDAMKKSRSSFELKIHGTSMLPLIDDGDTIFLKKTNIYKLGDIIVFEHTHGTVLAHRLLFKTRNHLFIKGDSTVAIDKVRRESLLGYVYKIKKADITICITRGLFIYSVIILSFLMNRVWKYTGSFPKASSSIFARRLKRILVKQYTLYS